MVSVKKIDDERYEVKVEDQTHTTHQVTLKNAYYQKLTKGKINPEALIKKSFEFLLERESNTMILSSFDLTIIQNYFSDYERTIISQ